MNLLHNATQADLLEKVKSIFDGDDFEAIDGENEVTISKAYSFVRDGFSFSMGEQFLTEYGIYVNDTRNAEFKGDKIRLYHDSEYDTPLSEEYFIDFPQDPNSEDFEGILMFVEDWLNGEIKGDANQEVKEYIEEALV